MDDNGIAGDIITPKEVAFLLHIHLKTVYKLAELGDLPGAKIGRTWRFRRSVILGLLEKTK